MARHVFRPTQYHVTLGSHSPVLRVAPGDTIATTTVDASGHNAEGERVAGRPNAQSGPFYVEGAEPGDTLVVHLDHMAPNRDTGYTASVVAANVVDPEDAAGLPAPERAEWRIDAAAQTAALVSPQPALGAFTVPLRPMLGCFGVAPPDGQAISTATSGPHGGNMDYRGFTTGATAYFPVFVPGALLHVGDGHARQGDGEIVGTGIETSFEVRMRVDLRKGWRTRWPRGENATHLFTCGNARPLDQALQHATSEMLRWLCEDHALQPREASILLGQCVEYEVGNVFDPAYTMVCKLEKRWLPKGR